MAAPSHDALATTVYVGGLPRGTTSGALAAAFASHIPVVHAVSVRTFGFVTFAEAEDAKRAVELDIMIDGRQEDQPYDEDFESDEELEDEAEGGAGGSSEADDACVEAMASFVSESREWALGVQGFLVEHCRDFDDREENKLEWYELHSTLTSQMERLLEAELAKLGVPVGDFVARLESSPESKAASELVETVLAMDDFVRFKSMMIKLRADLERALQPIEQDFNVRFAR